MKPVKPLSLLLLCLFLGSSAVAHQRQTENVILVTLDGARIQEIFSGLDLEILKRAVKEGKVEDCPAYRKYWAATPQARRERLMPFFWGTWMKKHGHIYGNRSLGSTASGSIGSRRTFIG